MCVCVCARSVCVCADIDEKAWKNSFPPHQMANLIHTTQSATSIANASNHTVFSSIVHQRHGQTERQSIRAFNVYFFFGGDNISRDHFHAIHNDFHRCPNNIEINGSGRMARACVCSWCSYCAVRPHVRLYMQCMYTDRVVGRVCVCVAVCTYGRFTSTLFIALPVVHRQTFYRT